MQLPVVGLNMDYTCYPKYPASDPQFRDCYDVYAPYIDRIATAGGLPLPIPPLENHQLLEKYLDRLDGFVFTGGEDYPPEFYGEKPQPERMAGDGNQCRLFDVFITACREEPASSGR